MATSVGRSAEIYNASLSRREVRLLSDWERERRRTVTIEDLRSAVGAAIAPRVAHQLVRKGALQRLRPGSYLIRPLRALARASEPSTPVLVEALLGEERHYLGGLWAISLHGFSEQRYAAVVDAFVTHRLASRTLGAGRVRFHALPKHAFEYGVTTAEIEGIAVHVSDPERTLLDALDHPRIFGGIARALEIAHEHLAGLDAKRLVQYAVKGARSSTCQRLGVLLERAQLSAKALAPLRSKARSTRSLLSMDPDAPRGGPVNKRWNVVENDR
jgi:predicted transcriptional regulator of viral defense system